MDRLFGICERNHPFVFNTRHLREVWTVEIQIGQADVFAMVRKGKSEVHRDGGSTGSSSPDEYENDVFHIDFCFPGKYCGPAAPLCGGTCVTFFIAGLLILCRSITHKLASWNGPGIDKTEMDSSAGI
jgi:hypothetical protein